MKTVLLLGGTADARELEKTLRVQGLSVIYSIAGLVRVPDVACDIVSGGFSQFGGLTSYIKNRRVDAIVDATHPYAEKMSATAVQSAAICGIPCWRFNRPAWKQEQSDSWKTFDNWQTLIRALTDKKSVFFTAGQLPQSVLDALVGNNKNCQHQLLRTAVKPKEELPDSMVWIKAIGPFSRQGENELMEKFQVDVLVSKNSGGNATSAKLLAARESNISVFMLRRPILPSADKEFDDLAACAKQVMQWLH